MRAILIFLVFLWSIPGHAALLQVEAQLGALVQPTSAYLHRMQGLLVQVPLFSERGFIQGRVAVRPEHRGAGFASGDELWSIVGGAAVPLGPGMFQSGLGLGSASGYVRKLSSGGESRYEQSTFNVTLGYVLAIFDTFAISLRHETAIGIGDDRQRKAFVSWPFQTYSIGAGVRL